MALKPLCYFIYKEPIFNEVTNPYWNLGPEPEGDYNSEDDEWELQEDF